MQTWKKLGKYKFTFSFSNPKLNYNWLYHFGFRLIVLDFYFTDLVSWVIIFNFKIQIEKLFK